MRIYFLRHGAAEDQASDHTDFSRRLTPDGRSIVRREAETMLRLGVNLDAIVSSPYLRAKETAEIVADTLECSSILEFDARLGCGCRLGDLQKIVEEREKVRRILFVGHEPDFSTMAGMLCGGAWIELKKGGLIRLEVSKIEPGRGMLEWVLTPKILTGL